jgi:hypothetical protein
MSATNNDSSDAQEGMLGAVPGALAVGRGPVPDGNFSRHDYHHPAAGWGAARSVGRVLEEQGTPVEGVRGRGAELVHINPLLEAASRRTIVPHEFADMATFRSTRIGTRNVQVRIGGDMALMRGVAKVLSSGPRSIRP